ncbi:MAG: hypothetical protein NTZ05_06205, partial [Chloroflexi bacterium]|nr:hypothetical protein [Chloroflexota bacterium]
MRAVAGVVSVDLAVAAADVHHAVGDHWGGEAEAGDGQGDGPARRGLLGDCGLIAIEAGALGGAAEHGPVAG